MSESSGRREGEDGNEGKDDEWKNRWVGKEEGEGEKENVIS